MKLETSKTPCCSKPSDEVVQVGIGDDRIGLIALNQIFEQLRVLGRPPDRMVEDELLLMVGARNYIPKCLSTASKSHEEIRPPAKPCESI